MNRSEAWLWSISVAGALLLHGGLALALSGTAAKEPLPAPRLQISLAKLSQPKSDATLLKVLSSAPISAVPPRANAVPIPQAAPLAATAHTASASATTPTTPHATAIEPVSSILEPTSSAHTAISISSNIAAAPLQQPLAVATPPVASAIAVATPVATAVPMPSSLVAASGAIEPPPEAALAPITPSAVLTGLSSNTPSVHLGPVGSSAAPVKASAVATNSLIPPTAILPNQPSQTALPTSSATPTVAMMPDPAVTATSNLSAGSAVATLPTDTPHIEPGPIGASAAAVAVNTPSHPATSLVLPTTVVPNAHDQTVMEASIPAVPSVTAVEPPTVPGIEAVQQFLSTYNGGSCFAAMPSLDAAGQVSLSAFVGSLDDSAALLNALGHKFPEPPLVGSYPVQPVQCSALSFTQAQTAAVPPQMILNTDRLASGDELKLTIRHAAGLEVHVLIVDDDGLVSLADNYLQGGTTTDHLSAPVVQTGQAASRVQLVIALASREPLHTFPDSEGAPATLYFDALSKELQQSGVAVGVALAAFSVQ